MVLSKEELQEKIENNPFLESVRCKQCLHFFPRRLRKKSGSIRRSNIQKVGSVTCCKSCSKKYNSYGSLNRRRVKKEMKVTVYN